MHLVVSANAFNSLLLCKLRPIPLSYRRDPAGCRFVQVSKPAAHTISGILGGEVLASAMLLIDDALRGGGSVALMMFAA